MFTFVFSSSKFFAISSEITDANFLFARFKLFVMEKVNPEIIMFFRYL